MEARDTLKMYKDFYKLAKELQSHKLQSHDNDKLQSHDNDGNIESDAIKESNKIQDIQLLVGMEIEWIHEDTLNDIHQILKECNGIDYLVGSVHHVHEIPIDYDQEMFELAITKASSIDQLFQDYFDAQYDMLQKVSLN